MTRKTSIRCETLGELVLKARDAGRNNHLVLSYDDPGKRHIGFRDVDEDVIFWVPLTRVISTDEHGGYKPKPGENRPAIPPPAETWPAILQSIGLTKGKLGTFIRTSKGRETFAALLSGRTGLPEEVAANDAAKAKRDRLFQKAHRPCQQCGR
jgi:hypothetical protein